MSSLTVTVMGLDKKEVTLTLRPLSEMGGGPNTVVDAETFARFKEDAKNYTRETFLAEYEVLKELALADKDYPTVRKIIADIISLKLGDPDYVLTEQELAYITPPTPPDPPPRTDEDLSVLPPESAHEPPVQDGPYSDNHSDPPGDSHAKFEENKQKTLRTFTAELCQEARDPPADFDKEKAYINLKVLHRNTSLRGTLNLARLALRAQCRICDIPSPADRKATISRQQQQESEAAEQTAASVAVEEQMGTSVAVEKASAATPAAEATTTDGETAGGEAAEKKPTAEKPGAEKPTAEKPFVWPVDVIIDELVQKHLKLERTAKRVPYTERYDVKIIPRNQKTKHELEVEHEQNYDVTVDTHPLDEPMPPKPKDHPYPDDLDPPRIIPEGMDRYLGWNLIDRNGEALPDWCWCYMDYRRENWRKHPLRKPVELTEEQKQQKALHDAYEKRLAKEARNRKWRKAFLPPDLQ